MSSVSIGQNLVSNGSFENPVECVSSWYNIDNALGWFKLSGGGGGDPDHLLSCNGTVPNNFRGTQQSYLGNSYAFLGVYTPATSIIRREYFYQELSSNLISGKKYVASFVVSLADNFQYGSDGVGVFFSDTALYWTNNNYIPVTPQVQNNAGSIISDTVNWVRIQDSFIADGTETFITIGNFKDDFNTQILNINPGASNQGYSGFYIDDVQLHEIPAFKSDSTHFICAGIIDSVFLDLSDTSEVTTYSWFPTNGLTNPTLPQTWAQPSVTTTYTLSQYTPCDTSTIDVTVFVGANACDSLTTGVSTLNTQHSTPLLYPNPNTGEFTFNYELTEPAQLVVYTITGQELSTHQLQAESKTIRIFDNELENGIYFYKVLIKDEIKYTGKFAIVK